MQIVIQYIDDCPYWPIAVRRVRTALQRAELSASVREQRIPSHEEAVLANFRGSPTILIDGIDAFADDDLPVGMTCRLYDTPQGRFEIPTVRQIVGALTAAVVAPIH